MFAIRLLMVVIVAAGTSLTMAISYLQLSTSLELNARYAATSLGPAFDWPDDPAAADPEDAYQILSSVATRYHVNIIRTNVAPTLAGKEKITQYAYLAEPFSGLFSSIKLATGRWPTQEELDKGEALTSTESEEGSPRVGVPLVLGHNVAISVEPLQRAFERLPASGRYTIETHDKAIATSVVDTINERLRSEGSSGTIQLGPIEGEASNNLVYLSRSVLLSASVLLCLCVVLLSAFFVRRESRTVGVLALLGFSPLRTWWKLSGKTITISAGASVGIAALAVSTLIGMNSWVLLSLLYSSILFNVAAICSSLVGYLTTLRRNPIDELIRGK